jgi:hypothetical protein
MRNYAAAGRMVGPKVSRQSEDARLPADVTGGAGVPGVRHVTKPGFLWKSMTRQLMIKSAA